MLRMISYGCIFCAFCNLSLAQDSTKSWQQHLQLGISFSNGRNTFPRMEVLLGNDLGILLYNGDLARQHLFDVAGSWRFRQLPIEPYVSVGYWHFEQVGGFFNYRWREDRAELGPGSFQTNSNSFTQRRFAANVGSKLHLTNWLYVRGGLSLVATISSDDWEGTNGVAANNTYRPAFELHKYWQPTHWYGSYGAGLQGWGFFAEYYQQHSFSNFVSHIRYRGTDYKANFGRNSNYGIALGYRASVAQIKAFFNNKVIPAKRMGTLF